MLEIIIKILGAFITFIGLTAVIFVIGSFIFNIGLLLYELYDDNKK